MSSKIIQCKLQGWEIFPGATYIDMTQKKHFQMLNNWFELPSNHEMNFPCINCSRILDVHWYCYRNYHWDQFVIMASNLSNHSNEMDWINDKTDSTECSSISVPFSSYRNISSSSMSFRGNILKIHKLQDISIVFICWWSPGQRLRYFMWNTNWQTLHSIFFQWDNNRLMQIGQLAIRQVMQLCHSV